MSAHWSERREGGSRFALWLIRNICLRLGRPAARLFLYPTTLYFFFRRGPERRQSRAFLSRALGRPASIWAVLKHLHCYAATILDRIFLLSDSRWSDSLPRFDIRVHGLEHLETQMAHGRGVLLLGAHIGSFEVLRVLAVERPDVQVRVVMDTQQTPAMTAMMHALNPAVAAGVIDAGQDGTAIALAIQDAANQGALIGLLADRARPREATRDATFFGNPAPIPIAPYLIASVLKLPVVLCFALFRGGNRYDLYFETFAECLQIARHERDAKLGEWTQRYAARLEHYTRMDPFNWFNFYDFWHRFDDARPAVRDSVSARSAA
jgi:predicted LPLAT superfamily acyltransferase